MCSYITGVGSVLKIETNLSIIAVTDKNFKRLERAPGVGVHEIKKATEGTFIVEGDFPEMQLNKI